MSALDQRLIDLAEKTGRNDRLLFARTDGVLATAEKANLVRAINELALTIDISVGPTPPANPVINQLWVDTGA